MAKSLYLIDGYAQIFRAYYAPFRNLTAPSGEPTRATHVFWSMLLNLLRDEQPDYLAVALDTSDETVFRREIFPDYKATREAPPEDLPPQIERIVGMLAAARIPLLRKERFEADDLIATLAHRLASADLHIVIVSRDKDLEQVLDEHVSMFDPFKSERITPAALLEKKGWTPDQAIDAQALTGDTVDNVPGVPGIGPKTAAKLLKKYGSADEIVAHVHDLTPKQSENVAAWAPQLPMLRELLRLKTDVEFDFDLDAALPDRFDWNAVRAAFDELGIRRLREQIPSAGGPSHDHDSERTPNPAPSNAPELRAVATPPRAATVVPAPEQVTYTTVDTPSALAEFAKQLAAQSAFCFDTETTGLHAIDAELVGLAFSWDVGHGWYLPTRAFLGNTLPLDDVRTALTPAFQNEDSLKIGHNLKYDLLVLRQVGFKVSGPLFDTMIASFVLEPTRGSFKLDKLVLDHFGHQMIPITDLLGRGKDQITMDQVPVEQVSEYAAEDADLTWRLYKHFEPQLADNDAGRLFYETEMPLVRVLTDMEARGIAINADMLAAMSKDLATRMDALTQAAHEAAGRQFNLDSPKQLGEILFDQLQLPVVRKTRTSRSTDAETLAKLAAEHDHPLPGVLLEYREIQKLRSTYVDALPKTRSKRTGRIHTSFHQTGAITGRLSSSEPNLQNIPIRTEQGRQIRRAFVPGDTDQVLIVADYSQVELRMLAHFCADEALRSAFAEDQDIHRFVAAQLNGVELADVTAAQRAKAKAVNFGIIYGQTAFGLAQTTGMSRSEAQNFIDDYFKRYPRIAAFIEECVDNAKTTGYARTLLGRRRPIPEIESRNRMHRAQAERLAVNTVIQGSAADLIKLAMIELDRKIRDEQLPLRLLLQVHDELVCEAPHAQAQPLGNVLAETMRNALDLTVPLKVDVGSGANWLDAK